MSEPALPYRPSRHAAGQFVPLRGLRYHLQRWGELQAAAPERPALVMLHGWMDVGASFQFVVDALHALGDDRVVIAPDWRGFGRSGHHAGADSYWFPDYLADLDALLDAVLPGQAVDLLGHSMGGNVAMLYAGVRPERIRRLVNLEGFGMPQTQPDQAPRRYRQWLDELKQPAELKPYDSAEAVAARLRKTNPRLAEDKAAWLAREWAAEGGDGLWRLRADAAHKHSNPVLYRKEEVLACWRRITAPVLWVEGADTDTRVWWGDRYPRSDFEERLAQVPQLQREVLPDCGHMLHHDQPQRLAKHLAAFLG